MYIFAVKMANDYFRFKQFTVSQSRCAMKVGTDGTLLGAWAEGGSEILDIGTGTGLIALMMAQRFRDARITGVDIDADAAAQARDNVAQSPFAGRINIECADVLQMQGQYDCIVSNPPYFSNALLSPDRQRTLARHTESLTYRSLWQAVSRLLTDDGKFSLVVPFDYRQKVMEEAALAGFFLHREWAVKTTPAKAPRRFLLAFGRHPIKTADQGTGILEASPGQRSEWYRQLTDDFYL